MASVESHLENYLHELQEIRSSGEATDETSYYPPLSDLLNSVGSELKPKVRCILLLKNRGAGHPDGGLFTKDQFQRLKDDQPLPGQKPGRGAIEVKSTSDDAWVTADSDQVTKYWREYGQVLVTNYRDFVLLGSDAEGAPVKLASYRLAPDERTFWRLATHPQKAAMEQGARFGDFLKLAMLSPAKLTEPKDVAWVLAYYAREAKARIESQSELPALANIRAALEQALGLKFEGEKGEHFFRSSLVQTLFYGVFSAWVLWSKQQPAKNAASKKPPGASLFPAAKFDWRLAQWSLRVPMIRVLFEQIATQTHLGQLNLVEVLDWTASALNRVDRVEFFARFQDQEAVQYFYEPFLEAFDPDLRKELGVWYTPIEIVKYMVARVHTILREELNLEDGLADPNVYVLDPGCGTGAYLVEVLKTIAATLAAKGNDALAAQDVKQAAMNRVFGFELLPAPFVISHLQLGLLLQNLGAPLAEDGKERVGVYLTNSLTGWEPPKGAKLKLAFPEMEAERDAADKVKRDAPILVIIGNPPYNAFAGVSPAEEESLVELYKGVYWQDKINQKTGKTVKDRQGNPAKQRRYRLSDPESNGGWDIRKFNLDDLYVRFFRLAERRLTEKSSKGIISYVSNYSYLSDPSYVIMRERLLSGFGKVWIDCMNGDSRETGKTTPAGKPDPSIFPTESNPEGIQLGTAVCLMARSEKFTTPSVRYRDLWGVNKRTELLGSLRGATDASYESARPSKANRFSLRPSSVTPDYDLWPRPIDLCRDAPISGLQEMRGSTLIDSDKAALQTRMKQYFDPGIEWPSLAAAGHGLTLDAGRFNAQEARVRLMEKEKYDDHRLVRYSLHPLDTYWTYHSNTRPLWNEPRPDLAVQVWSGNELFVVRMFAERAKEGPPLMTTSLLPDYHLLRPNAVAIPFRIRPEEPQDDGHHGRIQAREDVSHEPTANLSANARRYLTSLGLESPDSNVDIAAAIWHHSLAIGYSELYLSENIYGVRYNWPRIPLPATKSALLKSAELGKSIAALLNTETEVKNVTSGPMRPELKAVGNITSSEGGTLDPARDLLIDAGWGHEGKEGITMPGKGKLVERDYTAAEREAITQGAAVLGLTSEQAFVQLGERTCDAYLNARAYWKNIPAKVWDYYIGGYQVIKKWLSYREGKLLGRALTVEEARYVGNMARRIAALCLLQPQLDANYAAVKADTYPWPGVKG